MAKKKTVKASAPPPGTFTRLGRILVRKGKTAGLFMPFSQPGQLKNGIWEVREVLGELTLKYIGVPALPDVQYQGLDPQGLLCKSHLIGVTEEEYDAAMQYLRDVLGEDNGGKYAI